MPVILSIEELNDEFEIGYLIKTTGGGEMKIKMSNGSLCCETYYVGVLHNKQNVHSQLEQWNGKNITNIKISPKQGRVFRNEDYEDNDEYAEEIENDDVVDEPKDENGIEDDCDARYRTVSIYTENDELPLVIYLYNCHNSFYSHRCIIKWKNIQGLHP